MILHDLSAGMHPRRVRIFMAEKGLSIERREVDAAGGANAMPDFLRLNPLGKLPVLELDDGSAIAESLAICRYLEAIHPQPPLMGKTPQASAHIEMWTLRMDHELSQPIALAFVHSSDFYRGRLEQVPEVALWARARALQTMTWLDGELAGRSHIAGEDYSLADIVAQCAFVLGKAVSLRIPAAQANLMRWFAEVSARPTARA
ncbi:MAG: glutathione S-transferase family protein [Betaproteobacteria bacterium]|nr:glutathione S-transferase family protein [Betaproteobacteria bacterium]NBO45174.1 glutathione S-transferase family protein [Betaproteobacteria bacterium]NBO95306.1 glutathione S-transferase family protein [Betaproteobacteria bacterium]NBP11508.1 glutathione S-transferase family protein [Betaproteobacteria bacterium]NBP62940.1 glutathione S-transferase family protein [Betaproteobacteria bacterium]